MKTAETIFAAGGVHGKNEGIKEAGLSAGRVFALRPTRRVPFSQRWEFARAAGSHALARANFFEGRLA